MKPHTIHRIDVGSALAIAFACALAPSALRAQVDAQQCGPVFGTGWVGPYDYRSVARHLLVEIEQHHFTPEVERLTRGKTADTPGPDLNYTLMTVPNHHRALVSTVNLATKLKNDKPRGLSYPMECYFERAIRFKPDDRVAQGLYTEWLIKRGRVGEAESRLVEAVKAAGDNPLSHYTLGLLYLEAGQSDKALTQAHRALALGWPQQGLADRLRTAGKWREPVTAEAASAPMATKP